MHGMHGRRGGSSLQSSRDDIVEWKQGDCYKKFFAQYTKLGEGSEGHDEA